MLLTPLDSGWKPRNKLQDQLKQNLAQNCLDFWDLVDRYNFQCDVSFLLQSLIQL